jgi:hypothetical protein
MAIPGLGYRTAADVLMEVSLHLAQPAVYQTLTAPIAAGAGVTATVASTFYMYPGAQVVIELPGAAAQEVVYVNTVPTGTTFTANFANAHAAGVPAWAPTFPTQEATDPIFTQSEMLQYLSRAQNEFLTAVPCFYERFFQTVAAGNIYQSTPPTAILIDRIAASPIDIAIVSLVRSGNIVTLTAVSPTNLVQYNTFSVANPTDPSYSGSFAVISNPTPTTLTYRQIGANSSTSGGTIQSMRRLYEVTQEELVQQNRSWQVNYTNPLQSWFEDRAGLYRWGVGGIPQSTFPVELLCAVRDTDTLGFLDGFLVPDVCVHALKWLTASFAWSKDGVAAQPQMAEFAMKRYAQIVMATQRYIQAMKMSTR